MRRLRNTAALGATAVAIAVAVAACGSSGGSSGSTGATASGGATNANATTSGSTHATVAARKVNGIGNVLVDSHGMALYTPEQEASGMIRCTGECTSIWIPLTPSAGKPTAEGNAGTLAVVRRSDGTRQVTTNGQPLYTFAEDTAAGQVTGNGVRDQFGSQHFTWHAVLAGGKTASASGGSMGSDSTSESGEYGGGGGY